MSDLIGFIQNSIAVVLEFLVKGLILVILFGIIPAVFIVGIISLSSVKP